MGLISTKCESLFGRPHKRLKTDDRSRGDNTFRVRDQTLNDPEWNKLPYVVVLEIYRLLPTKEKHKMALTCKAWLQPFSRPSIWRQGLFRFNGADDWRAMTFVSKMGCGLRHITVDCSATYSENEETREINSPSKCLDFFQILIEAKNHSIVTLKVTDMLRFGNLLVRSDMVNVLVTLLKEQMNLNTLSLVNTGLHCDQSLMLLGAACTKSDTRIQRVEIVEYSLSTDYLHEDARFLCFIERLTNLSELSLSYIFLSDDLLFLLSRPTSEKLSFIRVWASHSSLVDSVTSPEAWDCLVSRCPSLRAEYVIWGRSDDQSLCNILTRKLPLNYLYWDTGTIINPTNIRSCLTYIRASFSNHLQQLHLEFSNIITVEEDVARIVEGCLLLEILTIKSVYLHHDRETRLVRSIRSAVSHQPASRLKQLTINDTEMELKESPLTLFLSWLFDTLQ